MEGNHISEWFLLCSDSPGRWLVPQKLIRSHGQAQLVAACPMWVICLRDLMSLLLPQSHVRLQPRGQVSRWRFQKHSRAGGQAQAVTAVHYW